MFRASRRLWVFRLTFRSSGRYWRRSSHFRPYPARGR